MSNREPVGHTCPKIDRIINDINAVLKLAESASDIYDKDDLLQIMEEIQDELFNTENICEEIRSANEELRSWGNEEADKCDELQEEVNHLEQQADEQQETINELKAELIEAEN